ncbi:MAG: alpha-ketoacid dehydrogenase subunit beta, partial [Nitrospinae bacterium]|nr:alpha-ketoacid dehydrogenase subunit beta [Nitrospinota bacterium]
MGEDIQSGVYGASGGLAAEFGKERVRDCPLSENAFFGAAVGAAAVGMRPLVESAFCFSWVAMDSLVSQAAKMRYMFGGQVNLPIVYRLSLYYGGSMAAHHSDRAHPIFMHIPGFKVVFASTAYDAKGLLKTAIREDDPVIFCEDRTVLGSRAHVSEEEYLIPFGVADIKREGTDVTVVAIGGMVPRALQAAEQLAEEGIAVEVVDPRTL